MAGYYPAYAQGPVYLGTQDVPEMERLEFYPRPAYHPHTGRGIRRHSSQLQIDADIFPTAPAGLRMLLQDGSFAASAPLSPPYDEMTLTGATHIVGEHTAAYPQGDSSAMVRVEPPAYRPPNPEYSPERNRKPSPPSWLDAVSRACDAPTNRGMVMHRGPGRGPRNPPYPPSHLRAREEHPPYRGVPLPANPSPDAPATDNHAHARHDSREYWQLPRPLPEHLWEGEQRRYDSVPYGSHLPYAAHHEYESEMSAHARYARRYNSRADHEHERRMHSRDLENMEHSHGFCAKCAVRDHERLQHERYAHDPRYHDHRYHGYDRSGYGCYGRNPPPLPPAYPPAPAPAPVPAAAAAAPQKGGSQGGSVAAKGVAEELEEDAMPKSEAKEIWRGTTWDIFPFLLMCCAPICCVVRRWHITEDRIDLVHSCCGTKEDTIWVRRIKDVSLTGDCPTATFCCGRNTITIHSNDQSHPKLNITTWGARRIFHELREAKVTRHGFNLDDAD